MVSFQKFIPKNKNIFLFLVLIFLFLPLPARGMLLVDDLLTCLLWVVFKIVLFFPKITGALLDTVTSPGFISYSYTNPGGEHGNPIIASGLGVTQSFVNIFLVIALIYIALSIALRTVQETEAKKMLARLILVALLVNFAPVICGLIVDASNIVMYSFLHPPKELVTAEAGGLGEVGPSGGLSNYADILDDQIKGLCGLHWSIEGSIGQIFRGVIGIITAIAIGIALFLFAGIFLVRYFAIWISVILAPLAFAAWIIPPTRKFWTMWWNQFIQWSIIGIPMAFFLLLGVNAFGALQTFKPQAEGIITLTEDGFFDESLPYLTTIVFLYLGFIVGLQTSAMGGTATINLVKKGGIWGAKTAGKIGLRTGRKGVGWAERKLKLKEGRIKEWAEAQAAARLPGFKGKGWGGKFLTGLGYATWVVPTFYALRRGIGKAGIGLVGLSKKDIGEGEKEYEEATVERMAADFTSLPVSSEKKIAILKKAADRGMTGDLIDHLEKSGMNKDQIKSSIIKIGKEALRIDVEEFKKIRDTFPHLAEEMGKDFADVVRKEAKVDVEEARARGYSGVADRLIIEMPSSKAALVHSDAWLEPIIMQALIMKGTGEKVAAIARQQGKAFVDIFNRYTKGRAEDIKKVNPPLYQFLQRIPAQVLGLRTI